MKGAGNPIDVFLSPIAFAKYRVQFLSNEIKYEVLVADFQTKIEEEERARFMNRNAAVLSKYSRYADVSKGGLELRVKWTVFSLFAFQK